MLARRHNITGVPMLSIGTTKNDRGHVLTRYCVNYKGPEAEPKSASFYFGENKRQIEAFIEACEFLRELGKPVPSKATLKRIYRDKKHDSLI